MRVAIIGNPNSGKTTVFNALTGLRHKIGNYPGVTVERREARLEGSNVSVIDLPGAYSLVPRSTDERLARDVLLGWVDGEPAVDAVLVVTDASNLERHLYLTTQIIDLGYPVVMCCNMMDAVGDQVLDLETLSTRLGVPVVETVANRGRGIDQLTRVLNGLRPAQHGVSRRLELPPEVDQAVARLAERIEALELARRGYERTLAELVLESDDHVPPALAADVDRAIERLASQGVLRPEKAMVHARYAKVADLLGQSPADPGRRGWADRVDNLVTHPLIGVGLFSALMFVMFLAIFSWASPLMDGIESVLGSLGEAISAVVPAGILQSLLVDGVVAGVGAVVVFLPQICILFFFICLLEDSGYMARAAMLMNRLMRVVGLPGRSFIPLLSSFACAIPGIMAARTIENDKDRLVTILIAPLMSCSARLPVYTILIGALFAGSVWLQAAILLSMYLLGIISALLVAWILKRTILKGPQPAFVIELPPYRRPRLRVVLRAMWDRSVLFLRDAGTVIFAVSVVLWAAAYFPRADAAAAAADPSLQISQSVLGKIGHAIEPLIEPLGYDWQIGIGLVGSFAAREVFVSTMGIVYGVGEEHLRERLDYTPLVGISLMVFYVLACQCVSTLGVAKRETGGWRWPLFMFGYMTVLAYVGALVVYQGGLALGYG